MSSNTGLPVQDSLTTLLREEGVERVAIVDDAFDSIAHRGLKDEEANDLWANLEFDDGFHAQVERIGKRVDTANDLTGELIDEFLVNKAEVPRFDEVWSQSLAGVRTSERLQPVMALRNQLQGPLKLHVQTYGSDTEPSTLVDYDPQLIFLDWYLGDDGAQTAGAIIPDAGTHPAVLAAANKAREILEGWPKDKPKPLIILMSSKPGVEADAGAFCRQAKILRGMFYAVPKATLSDSFSLRLHLNLFAMSLPAGRRLQSFMDTLRQEFETARMGFLDTLSDLTLTDYACIQRLCLQNEGQPLGDYLLWLFSTYLGQKLFAEGLKEVGNDLDTMTFEQAVPSAGPPSATLADIYHTALFDTSVGPVVSHPLAETNENAPEQVHPAIALGDVLRYQGRTAIDTDESGDVVAEEGSDTEKELRPPSDTNAESVEYSEDNQEDTSSKNGAGGESNPDLLVLINAQCDLAYRPDAEDATDSVNHLAIVLLPGTLNPLGAKRSGPSKPKTELYQQDGQNYRIEWDTKNVQTIPFARFREWMKDKGYERSSRLRLPHALEIQRAFASDVTRIGSPVSPPIYQPIEIQLLRPNSQGNAYEALDGVEEGEAAFLVLTRSGQQCVFTLPLLAKLRKLLADRGVTIEEADWVKLRSPFKLPALSNPWTLSSGRFRIERGAKQGQECHSSFAVTVGLDIDDADSP